MIDTSFQQVKRAWIKNDAKNCATSISVLKGGEKLI